MTNPAKIGKNFIARKFWVNLNLGVLFVTHMGISTVRGLKPRCNFLFIIYMYSRFNAKSGK